MIQKGSPLLQMLCRGFSKATEGGQGLSKDFVVVGGGEKEIVFDFIKGMGVDFFVIHTKKRMVGGGQG